MFLPGANTMTSPLEAISRVVRTALSSVSYLSESRVCLFAMFPCGCGFKDAKTVKSFPFLMGHVTTEVARTQSNRALCHVLNNSVPAFLDENLFLRILNMACTRHDCEHRFQGIQRAALYCTTGVR